jgi:ketosteroid isomerase-like protein
VNPNEENNLATVKSLYAAFGLGDIPTLFAALADDVEWILPGPPELIPFAGRHRGPDGVMQFFATLNETLEFEKLEAEDFFVKGDKVVVLGRSRTRMKANARAVENDWAAAITLRDGKVARYQIYEDTAALTSALH